MSALLRRRVRASSLAGLLKCLECVHTSSMVCMSGPKASGRAAKSEQSVTFRMCGPFEKLMQSRVFRIKGFPKAPQNRSSRSASGCAAASACSLGF